MDEFERILPAWLKGAAAGRLPDEVEGLSFNLFEVSEPKAKFGVELIGADRFDRDGELHVVWEAE